MTPREPSAELGAESPALASLVTNGFVVTPPAAVATLLDLVARGWLRVLPPDEEDELARVRPAATAFQGDSLLPHERLVLQHVLARYTSERAIPARYRKRVTSRQSPLLH